MKSNLHVLFTLLAVALLSACGGKVVVHTSDGHTYSSSTEANNPSNPSIPPVPGSNKCDLVNKPCAATEYCNLTTGKCEASSSCDVTHPCGSGLICDAGQCHPKYGCSISSECGADYLCIQNNCLKANSCSDSSTCQPGQRCIKNGCVNIAGQTDLCATGILQCGAKEKCEDNRCKPNCATTCGGVCCNDDQICFKSQCVRPCAAGEKMCGNGTSAPVCCGANEACIGDKCLPLDSSTPACNNTTDFCPLTRYCASYTDGNDQQQNNCIKYTDNPSLCLLPTVPEFDLVEKLHYDNPSVLPSYKQSIRIALVADVTGGTAGHPDGIPDGKPDIIVNTYENYGGRGVLRIISGTAGPGGLRDVLEYWHSKTTESADLPGEFWTESESTPAVGDLDGDGRPEIVVLGSDHNLVALHGDGSHYWEASSLSFSYWETVTIADLDHDGHPEILVGTFVINGQDGSIICDNLTWSQTPIAADLDESGNMEIITDGTTYSYDPTGTDSATRCVKRPTVSPYKDNVYGKYAAIADIFPEIPGPEIALIGGGYLYILDSHGGKIPLIDSDEPSDTTGGYKLPGGSAGPPTIGDFDGDERLEIAFADSSSYIITKPTYNPADSKFYIKKLWGEKTQDGSSGVTGSSIFDFDGDGRAEAVYFDEINLHIYDGITGKLKMLGGEPIKNSSYTDIEYPVIADVDADGHADIVVVANINGRKLGDEPDFFGVRVFTDRENRWVSTRKIWNQHTYHYTNVNDDGTIPTHEDPHWKKSWSNTFRQNVQKDNNRLAPDLSAHFVSLYNSKNCSNQDVRPVEYSIRNDGSKIVTAGSFTSVVYARVHGSTNPYAPIDTFQTTTDLAPGNEIKHTFDFDTNAAGLKDQELDLKLVIDDANNIIECNESNNTIELTDLAVQPPNVAVSIPSVSSLQCSGSGTNKQAHVVFELSNTGSSTIPAGSIEVEVKVTVSGSHETFKKLVTNTNDIAGGSFEKIETDVDLATAPENKSYDIEITADPNNKVNECNEGDNTTAVSAAIICYNLG